MGDGRLDRRGFLRFAAAGAVCAATAGQACSSESPQSGADRSATPAGASKANDGAPRRLRIAQWAHYVPAYDGWFDNEYCRQWGEKNNVEVVVDHLPVTELPIRGDAEAAAKHGHDLFWFINPRAGLEDDVIDHREIVEEVTAKLGKMTPHVERSVFNPKTRAFFAFPEHWAAGPVHYRSDLWERVEPGLRPATWDDVRRAAPTLKAQGHPIGLGISAEVDSNWTLTTLLHSYGSSLQNENADVTINTPATVEAVKVCADIYRRGMTDEVFAWDGASNNRLLTSGRGSLIVNAISALRAAEQQDADLAAKIALAPAPLGSAGNQPRSPHVVGNYVIWKFSPNRDLATRFLVDLALSCREAFVKSGFYNLPVFPGAMPDLPTLVAEDPAVHPADKYALLAESATWSTNAGHPGAFNAAIDEVFNLHLLPQMFSAAARGQATPAEAVAAAEAQMRPIFDKWKERGKI